MFHCYSLEKKIRKLDSQGRGAVHGLKPCLGGATQRQGQAPSEDEGEGPAPSLSITLPVFSRSNTYLMPADGGISSSSIDVCN